MKSTFTGVVCATVSLLFAAAVMGRGRMHARDPAWHARVERDFEHSGRSPRSQWIRVLRRQRATSSTRKLYSDGYTTDTFTGTGTYTIGANCIAQVTYDGGGTPFVYFVAPDGSAYYWANNQNAGTIASGRADRVSRGLLVK